MGPRAATAPPTSSSASDRPARPSSSAWGGHLAQSAYWNRPPGPPMEPDRSLARRGTCERCTDAAATRTRTKHPASAIVGELPRFALAPPTPRPTRRPTAPPAAPAPTPRPPGGGPGMAPAAQGPARQPQLPSIRRSRRARRDRAADVNRRSKPGRRTTSRRRRYALVTEPPLVCPGKRWQPQGEAAAPTAIGSPGGESPGRSHQRDPFATRQRDLLRRTLVAPTHRSWRRPSVNPASAVSPRHDRSGHGTAASPTASPAEDGRDIVILAIAIIALPSSSARGPSRVLAPLSRSRRSQRPRFAILDGLRARCAEERCER